MRDEFDKIIGYMPELASMPEVITALEEGVRRMSHDDVKWFYDLVMRMERGEVSDAELEHYARYGRPGGDRG